MTALFFSYGDYSIFFVKFAIGLFILLCFFFLLALALASVLYRIVFEVYELV